MVVDLIQASPSSGGALGAPVPLADIPGPADVIDAWRRGKKESTLRTYQYAAEYFLRYLVAKAGWMYPDGYEKADAGRLALAEMMRHHGRTNALAIGYMHWLENERIAEDGTVRTVASATVSIYVAALRSLVHAANLLGIISWRIDARSPKVVKYKNTAGPPTPTVGVLLAHYDRAALEPAPPRRRLAVMRDRAILRLMVNGALRRAEIVSLDVRHVDPKAHPEGSSVRGGVWLLGKGRRERELHQPGERAMAAIAEWLAAADGAGDLGDRGQFAPLFVALDNAHRGERLDPGGVYFVTERMEEVAEHEGAGAVLAPHRFRHWAVTQVASRKGIQQAAAFARHTNTAVTLRYIDNLNVRAAEGASAGEEAADEAVRAAEAGRMAGAPLGGADEPSE